MFMGIDAMAWCEESLTLILRLVYPMVSLAVFLGVPLHPWWLRPQIINYTFWMKEIQDVTIVLPIRKSGATETGTGPRPFAGRGSREAMSLLHWKIEQLLEVSEPTNILVSSNWDLALDVASAYGVRAVRRPEHLAQPDARFEQVIHHCASLVDTTHIAWSPATLPFMGPSEIRGTIASYMGLDSVDKESGMVAVSEERAYFFMGGHPLNFPVGKGHVRTQDIQPMVKLNWAFSIRPTEIVKAMSYMFAEAPNFFLIDRLANFHLSDESDFKMAQALTRLYEERIHP